MKLSITKRRLLFEAYRRNEMSDGFEKSKPIGERWLGLGTAAAYRVMIDSGLMRFFDGETPPPRCLGWLVLTEAGIKVMNEHKPEFQEIFDGMKRSGYDQSILSQY